MFDQVAFDIRADLYAIGVTLHGLLPQGLDGVAVTLLGVGVALFLGLGAALHHLASE